MVLNIGGNKYISCSAECCILCSYYLDINECTYYKNKQNISSSIFWKFPTETQEKISTKFINKIINLIGYFDLTYFNYKYEKETSDKTYTEDYYDKALQLIEK